MSTELASRLRNSVRRAMQLHRTGVTLRSAMLVPIRRRMRWVDDRIDLASELHISAPKDVPLLPLYREIWVDRCYLHERSPIADAPDIIDIGASVGVFALWAASEYPGAKIVAIEPSLRMCRYLRANIKESRRKNILVLNEACHSASGSATLYSPGSEAMNSLYPQDIHGHAFRPLQEVRLTTLAAVFERCAVRRGAFLKLDCEGSEYEILYAAPREVLERIDGISMEYHLGFNQHRPEELAVFLEGCGFEVVVGPLVYDDAGYLYAWRQARSRT